VLEAPSWPGTLERPPARGRTGLDYDTAWSRSPAARAARRVLLEGVTRPLTEAVAHPEVLGAEHLAPLEGPCIFAANHSSHLDTAVLLTALPPRYRRRCVVAAAADTFFDRRWKAALWSFALASIPIERARVNRASADLAAELIGEGWSVIIFPEGGRSTDGWGGEFRGGAAYLAKRCGVPVVPVHLHGVRPILPKGGSRLRPGRVGVRFGEALRPLGGGTGGPAAGDEDGLAGRGGRGGEEDARRFARRIEQAIAELADEAETDWWTARRRAARGETPPLSGPQVSPWRRSWELPESRVASPRRGAARSERPWQRRA